MGKVFDRVAWSRSVRGFIRDERGATAIEYGLIVSLIFLAILGALAGTGNSVTSGWAAMGAKVSAALQK